MRLIWTPPEGETREFLFRPNETLSPDAEAIELVGGEAWETWDGFVRLFHRGHRRALRAALWICRRRADEPHLRFAALVLRADEVKIDYDEDELKAMRAKTRADPDLDPETRAALLEAFGGDQPDDEEEAAAPKAPPSEPPSEPPATEPADTSSAG